MIINSILFSVSDSVINQLKITLEKEIHNACSAREECQRKEKEIEKLKRTLDQQQGKIMKLVLSLRTLKDFRLEKNNLRYLKFRVTTNLACTFYLFSLNQSDRLIIIFWRGDFIWF